jgi:transcriptional regulator with XRE-family HTH domain
MRKQIKGEFAAPVLTEIKVWMARRRLSQVELAKRMGVGTTWVNKRLTGEVATSVEDLGRFAVALGVPAAEFFVDASSQGKNGPGFVNFRSA